MLERSAFTRTWHDLAESVLSGRVINHKEGVAIVECPDDELLDLLSAAYRIRRRHFGNSVQLYYLMNAKSGLCAEDCSYCSQSKTATSEIPRYNLLDRKRLLEGAARAAERQSKTYCIVISARSPNERELAAVEEIVPAIKQEFDLKICTSLGMLNSDQAARLKACGVDRINHNLNTSSEHYEKICSTHTYQDRINTLHAVRDAGLEICSGGIIGMGETPGDVVRMALALRGLGVHSIPVNFLNSIEGTGLADLDQLNPRYCLKVLSMFRFTNPECEIRIAGGRELHLGSLQCMGLYAANSMFVGDYLTTDGQTAKEDFKMIDELGFEVTRHETVRSANQASSHHS